MGRARGSPPPALRSRDNQRYPYPNSIQRADAQSSDPDRSRERRRMLLRTLQWVCQAKRPWSRAPNAEASGTMGMERSLFGLTGRETSPTLA